VSTQLQLTNISYNITDCGKIKKKIIQMVPKDIKTKVNKRDNRQ
jgi:hypothetical protein